MPICGELVRAVGEVGLLAGGMEDDIRALPYVCLCVRCEVMVSFGRALYLCLDSLPSMKRREVSVGELIDDVT